MLKPTSPTRALGAAILATLVGTTAASAANQTVTLRFAAVAGSQHVTCGHTIDGLGSTQASAELQDLRFYVSGVKLIRSDGRLVRLSLGKNNRFNLTSKGTAVTLLDFENATGKCAEDGTRLTNTVVRGTVPPGRYVGVQFKVGVPAVLNHTDPTVTPAPLNSAALGWSWQTGRKFTKIELADPGTVYGRGWTSKVFNAHLGSTACTGNPAAGEAASCRTPNRALVTLKRFDFTRKLIALDLQRLTSGTDITANRGGAAGCMAGPTDPECRGVFSALGIDWRADGTGTGQPIAGGTAQRLFRIIRRSAPR